MNSFYYSSRWFKTLNDILNIRSFLDVEGLLWLDYWSLCLNWSINWIKVKTIRFRLILNLGLLTWRVQSETPKKYLISVNQKIKLNPPCLPKYGPTFRWICYDTFHDFKLDKPLDWYILRNDRKLWTFGNIRKVQCITKSLISQQKVTSIDQHLEQSMSNYGQSCWRFVTSPSNKTQETVRIYLFSTDNVTKKLQETFATKNSHFAKIRFAMTISVWNIKNIR